MERGKEMIKEIDTNRLENSLRSSNVVDIEALDAMNVVTVSFLGELRHTWLKPQLDTRPAFD